jgi:hypothetical protein
LKTGNGKIPINENNIVVPGLKKLSKKNHNLLENDAYWIDPTNGSIFILKIYN